MKVWAHRGYSGLYPENTMVAFRKAAEAGAYGVELDVHLSKDGKLVVIHDESLKRTCGIDRMVEDCTFKELTATSANVLHPEYEATIPSFEEFCSFLKETDMHVNVEIKSGIIWYRDIEEKTVAMVRDFGLEERVIFSSFNWLSVARCKTLAPYIPTGLLYEQPVNVAHVAYGAKNFGFDYIHPDRHFVDDTMVREAKDAGIGINVWTVNEREDMLAMKKWGVCGIITNFPDIALETIR